MVTTFNNFNLFGFVSIPIKWGYHNPYKILRTKTNNVYMMQVIVLRVIGHSTEDIMYRKKNMALYYMCSANKSL